MSVRLQMKKGEVNAAPVFSMKGELNDKTTSLYKSFILFDNVVTIIGFKMFPEKLVIRLFHNRDCNSSLWRTQAKIRAGVEFDGIEKPFVVREVMLFAEVNMVELLVTEDQNVLRRMRNNSMLCVSALFKDWEGLLLLRPFEFLRPKRSDDVTFEFSKKKVYAVNRTVIEYNTSQPIDPHEFVSAFAGNTKAFEVFLSFLFYTQMIEVDKGFPHVMDIVLSIVEEFGFDNVLSKIERFLCLRYTLSPAAKLHLASRFHLSELESAALKELTNLQMLQSLDRNALLFSQTVLRDILKRIKLLIKHQFHRDSTPDREDRTMISDKPLHDYACIDPIEDYDFVPLTTWEENIENTGYKRKQVVKHSKTIVTPENRCKPVSHLYTFNTNASNMWRKHSEIEFVVHRKGLRPIRDFLPHYAQGSSKPSIALSEPFSDINYKTNPATHIDLREKIQMEHGCWWSHESDATHEWPKKNQEEFVTINVNDTDVVFQKKKLLYYSSEFKEFLKCKSVKLPDSMSLCQFLKFFELAYNRKCQLNEDDVEDILTVAVWFKAVKVIDRVQSYLMDSQWDSVRLLVIAQKFCLEGVQASALQTIQYVEDLSEVLRNEELYDSCTAMALIHHASMLTTKEDREKNAQELQEIIIGVIQRNFDDSTEDDD